MRGGVVLAAIGVLVFLLGVIALPVYWSVPAYSFPTIDAIGLVLVASGLHV